MATKKITKVYLVTADPDNITTFDSIDKMIEVIAADQAKKPGEQTYKLNSKKGFFIVDNNHGVNYDFSKILAANQYHLSTAAIESVISEDTDVVYDGNGVTDHRIADYAADGDAKIANLNLQGSDKEIARNEFSATTKGTEAYQKAIADAQENALANPVDNNTTIEGYENVDLTLVGGSAATTTNGKTGMDEVTTVATPVAVSVKGGSTTINYVKDATRTVDKKDADLVRENGTETYVNSTVATGKLTAKDSNLVDITGGAQADIDDLKELYPNNDFDNSVVTPAGYDTVELDNTTVSGDITGGSETKTRTRTYTTESFLDKKKIDGFYNAAKDSQEAELTTANDKLYAYADSSTMLASEAATKAVTEGANIADEQVVENLVVNQYEIYTKDVDGNYTVATGKNVYLTVDEVGQLSIAAQNGLRLVDTAVGYADFTTDRVVTDANYDTFTTAPSGNQLNKTTVSKCIFYKTVEGKDVEVATYFLTDDNEADIILQDLGTGAKYDYKWDGKVSGMRAAETITAENYKTEAVEGKVYFTNSKYVSCTFSKGMTAAEAAAKNTELMKTGEEAWIATDADADESKLFAVQKYVDGKATLYYLTAGELSSLGAFGKDETGANVEKTYDDVAGTWVGNLFDAETGWTFVDAENRFALKDNEQLYRTGVAATEKTLDKYTQDKTDVVTATETKIYKLASIAYGDDNAKALFGKLIDCNKIYETNQSWFAGYLGEEGEYVVDGNVQYRTAGYKSGSLVTDDSLITSDAKSVNDVTYGYESKLEMSLTEEDAAAEGAYPTDGKLTQNTKLYKDLYVAKAADAYQENATHSFIEVKASQDEATSLSLTEGYRNLDVQATDADGKALYLTKVRSNEDSSILVDAETTAAQSGDVEVKYYQKGAGETQYALTEAEAALFNEGHPTEQLTAVSATVYHRSSTAGKFVEQEESAGEFCKISAFEVDLLSSLQMLQDTAFAVTDNAVDYKAVRVYDHLAYSEDSQSGYAQRLTVTDGTGKTVEAYYNALTGALTADENVTYNAIYEYTTDAGDDKVYYLTADEAKKVTDAKLTMGDQATVNGKYLYRVTEKTSTKIADYFTCSDYVTSYQQPETDKTAATFENTEAYESISNVFGEQVYKYSKDTTVAYLTEAEFEAYKNYEGEEGYVELTKGDAVAGVYHYGDGAAEVTVDLKKFAKAETMYFTTELGKTVTKLADGTYLQAYNGNFDQLYSNIDGEKFYTATEYGYTKLVGSAEIDCEPTYFYTQNTEKSYATDELEEIKASEEAQGIATWTQSKTEDGRVMWTRVDTDGNTNTYIAEYAEVQNAAKVDSNTASIATGTLTVKNGSEVKGTINGYKDVTVENSVIFNAFAENDVTTTTSDFSTKKGSIAKDNSQTITTTETTKNATSSDSIGSFTLSRTELKDDKLTTDAQWVDGYETVTVTGTNAGTFFGNGQQESNSESKQKITYTGDADALRDDYINQYAAIANVSGVVSKITYEKNKSHQANNSVGTFTATGRDYTFDVADKVRSNTIGYVHNYETVTLTNINAGNINGMPNQVTDTTTEYKLNSNAKKAKDTVVYTENSKFTDKNMGTLVAVNTVTDAANEADLTIGNVNDYQNVALTNVNAGAIGTLNDVTTTKFSNTRVFDATTMRNINENYFALKYEDDPTAGAKLATNGSWKDNVTKQTYNTTSKDVADGTLVATGRETTVAVENEATLNKYTQAGTGRVLYLTEKEAEKLDGVAGWTKDATQYYYRNTVSGKTVQDGFTGVTNVNTAYEYVYKAGTAEEKNFFVTDAEYAVLSSVDAKLKAATKGDAFVGDGQANVTYLDNEGHTEKEEGDVEVFKYVNTLDETDFLYLTAAELKALQTINSAYTDNTYEAEKGKDGKEVVYYRTGNGLSINYATYYLACQNVTTVYKYVKEDSTTYFLTEAEFKTLSTGDDAPLKGYAKDDDASAYMVMRNAATKVATKDNLDAFGTFLAQQGTQVTNGELNRTALTDDQVAELKLYGEDDLACYSANQVDEHKEAARTKIAGNITGYENVTLDTMNVTGSIDHFGGDNANETSTNASYSKSVSEKKGSTVYTEKSSQTTKSSQTVKGSVALTDTDVAGSITGYKSVTVETTAGKNSKIYGIDSRDFTNSTVTTADVKTTDSTASFDQETVNKTVTKTTAVSNQKELSIAGKRAAEKLVSTDETHYAAADKATAAAQEVVDAFNASGDGIADIQVTNEIKGYKNVSLTNVTMGGVVCSQAIKTNATNYSKVYSTTDNGADAANTASALIGYKAVTDNTTDLGYGTLTLTNVSGVSTYTAGASTQKTVEDATSANVYLFNGVKYLLTGVEKETFLPYATVYADEDKTYTAMARANSSVTAAYELKDGASIFDIKDNGHVSVAYKDNAYFKTDKVVELAGGTTNAYVRANQVDAWLKENTGCKVDTSTVVYAADYEQEISDPEKLLTKNVALFEVDGKNVYLTRAEAQIILNKTISEAEFKATGTRFSSLGDAVSADVPVSALSGDVLVDTYDYVGIDDKGAVVHYYLTDTEFTSFKAAGQLNDSFGKASTTAVKRNLGEASSFEEGMLNARSKDALVDEEKLGLGGVVKKYVSKDGTDTIFATATEFAYLQAFDSDYAEYKEDTADKTVYYGKVASIFTQNTLGDSYQAVDESEVVYAITNNLTGDVIGYLTAAEYAAFEAKYNSTLEEGDTKTFSTYFIKSNVSWLRSADDTTDVLKLNGISGDGYKVSDVTALNTYAYYLADITGTTAQYAANGFKKIEMVDSYLGSADGTKTVNKANSKVTGKATSEVGKFTQNDSWTQNCNIGTFTAVNGVNTVTGAVTGYKTVTLKGAIEKGEFTSTFGNFTSGKTVAKTTANGAVLLSNVGAYAWANVRKGSKTDTNKTISDGKFTAEDVTLGVISNYKDVAISFTAADDDKELAKRVVGGIIGGNSDSKTTTKRTMLDDSTIDSSTTVSKFTSVGTAVVENAAVGTIGISGHEKVTLTNSTVAGSVTGGKSVTTTLVYDVNGGNCSTDTTIESTATGKAAITASRISGSVSNFRDVNFVGGVEVAGNVSATVDSEQLIAARGQDNIVCYAVHYGYNAVTQAQYYNLVYLTADEYELFVKDEAYADAVIDLANPTYRNVNAYAETTDVATMAGYTVNTDESRTSNTYGYNGANPVKTVVKGYGNLFEIDADGAKIGGEVIGYQKVNVNGDASFGNGYEGTKKADTLTVAKDAELATFVNFDFGEGKDTLNLDGIIGTDVDLSNWNLEKISGTGTLLCKEDDVAAVKSLFDNKAAVEVVGSDNYSAATALNGLDLDSAIDLNLGDYNEWLGFCDETDYFKAQANGILRVNDLGSDASIQTSIDGGETWVDVAGSCVALVQGTFVKISLDEEKVSKDYTISFKA